MIAKQYAQHEASTHLKQCTTKIQEVETRASQNNAPQNEVVNGRQRKQQNCNECDDDDMRMADNESNIIAMGQRRSDDDIRMADNESNIIAMSQWRSDDDIRIADNESNRIAMSQNCNSNSQ